MIDPVTEADLNAYIDGQLDLGRRIEVEGHLADNPEIAARVMADLRGRDALSAAFAPAHPNLRPAPVPERIAAAARRLDRALVWRRIGARFQRAAVIAMLVGAGWLMHAETGSFGVPGLEAAPHSPAFVEDAIQARQTALVRARMASQRPTPAYDRKEVEAATGITLPDLPQDWQVHDLQVFPARSGAGVEVAIRPGRSARSRCSRPAPATPRRSPRDRPLGRRGDDLLEGRPRRLRPERRQRAGPRPRRGPARRPAPLTVPRDVAVPVPSRS